MGRWKISRKLKPKVAQSPTGRLPRSMHLHKYEQLDIESAIRMREKLATLYPQMERYFAESNAAFNLNGDIIENGVSKPGKNWRDETGVVHGTIVLGTGDGMTKCMRVFRINRRKPVHYVKSPVTCFACLSGG